VLECRLSQEVALEGGLNTLLIGRVEAIHLAEGLPLVPGTRFVDTGGLRPVGRLWGDHYALPGAVTSLARPRVVAAGAPRNASDG
jgi:flavin reductase (DIM6/NTAB) family NADH-FMN oxidoreductase RutF